MRILCDATPERLSEQAGLPSFAVGKVSLGPVFGASWHSDREILPILRPRDGVGQQQPVVGSVNPVKEQPVFDQAPSTDEASFLTSLTAVAVVVGGGAEHVRAWRDLR